MPGALEKGDGPLTVGHDPFFNDPKMFYDVILRRATGQCRLLLRRGVASSARGYYAERVALCTRRKTEIDRYTRDVTDAGLRDEGAGDETQVALDTELTPYKFHVSEDIYTSIVLHGDPERRWRFMPS